MHFQGFTSWVLVVFLLAARNGSGLFVKADWQRTNWLCLWWRDDRHRGWYSEERSYLRHEKVRTEQRYKVMLNHWCKKKQTFRRISACDAYVTTNYAHLVLVFSLPVFSWLTVYFCVFHWLHSESWSPNVTAELASVPLASVTQCCRSFSFSLICIS